MATAQNKRGSRVTVVVFGSINMDLVARVPRLLEPGETLIGSDFFTTPGGKGANQAVALAQLGVQTQLVGRVGGDAFGRELLSSLRRAGVQVDRVQVDASCRSGVAIITVANTGQNQIIGVFGANGEMGDADVQRLAGLLPTATALLLQLEIPLATVRSAAVLAREAGVQVILDPAPVPTVSLTELYPLIDILVPNEVEAGHLVGFPVNDAESAGRAATRLQQQGVRTVIVKLGAQGVFCATPDETFFTPAFSVKAIDTVAAGDAFAGGLVAALVEGLPIRQAVTWGAAAGALATTTIGAQSAMPNRATFADFLAHQDR